MPRISRLALATAGISLLAFGVFSLISSPGARAANSAVEVGDEWYCAPGDSACHTTDIGDTDVTTTINVGDTVTWTWVGSLPHTVTQCTDSTFATCSGGFDSGTHTDGSTTFSNPFNTAGAFFYECQVHLSSMRGEVVVAAQATSAPTASSAPTAGAASRTPTSTPTTGLPTTGGNPSDGFQWWAVALILAGALLLGGSAMLAVQTIRRR